MKKCILIFDDDPDILLVCKFILEQQNYRVETRLICTNVLEDIGEVNPDLILMDLWIPELGGEKAIQLIRKEAETRHVPVIVFSANDDIETISKQVNADGFVKKPFDIAHLSQIIAANTLEKN